MTLSREIFRQYDVRGIVGRDLTADTAYALGRAYAAYLASKGVSGSVAVGRDNRPSGDELRNALVRGLTECGLNVIDVGQVPTPLLYWSLNHLAVAGGIQVTGSHNPPEYNGFKLSLGTASIHGEEIQQIYRLAVAGKFPSGKGSVREQQIIDAYVDDIVARTGTLARRLKVVVDCGNGVGALVAPKLFDHLDVEWTGLFCDSDGTFPNHHPDPTVVENLQDLIKAVRSSGADLGVGFDGDADRIGVIDGDGNIVWGDHVLILYARDVLERTGAGQPIIFDVKCSQALPDEIVKAKGVPVMWKTGHSLMKDKMHELHAPVGGEMSGHMFFTEGFYGHDDALYGAARLIRIVAASGKSLSGMLADVPKVRFNAGAARGCRGVSQVPDRGGCDSAFPRDARSGRRRRRTRAVRRRLGTHSRLQYAARARDALRSAQRAASRRNPRRNGELAAHAGRVAIMSSS